jgi:hypothetical protein
LSQLQRFAQQLRGLTDFLVEAGRSDRVSGPEHQEHEHRKTGAAVDVRIEQRAEHAHEQQQAGNREPDEEADLVAPFRPHRDAHAGSRGRRLEGAFDYRRPALFVKRKYPFDLEASL